MKVVQAAVLGFSLLSFVGSTQAAIIDFENFTAGTIIDNEYVTSHGVTISGVNTYNTPDTNNVATVFDSNNFTGGDRDLAAPFYKNTDSQKENAFTPGNILVIHETASECNGITCTDPDDAGKSGSSGSGYFEFSFSEQTTLNSIDFFDIEYNEANAPKFAIELYSDDAFTNIVFEDIYYVPSTGGDNTWDRLFFADVTGVMSMRINFGGSGAIDNIDYTSVPAPSSLFLSILCFIGFRAFNKKNSKVK
ncbi:thrombospondin type 3 repeat:Cna B-type [Colwellia echini]|uniref:Thrombospondin type 3 repeat:Cna B-type n=1 Tax=Colwellia echini TaxID=1982103 RepID=A0ABY3MY79_9GAMM|nr:thrombospondin type 3 repeat:Cna B-type [Colwellia echini]TYK66183.1 thrombospondin type 3 repeat:Cna B-type [Colwellia echini]